MSLFCGSFLFSISASSVFAPTVSLCFSISLLLLSGSPSTCIFKIVYYRIAGIFRGVKFSWIWKILAGSWKKNPWLSVDSCMCALMGVARCIYGYCFVGKYFVVCFSTTKTTNILPPPQIPAIQYIIVETLDLLAVLHYPGGPLREVELESLESTCLSG